jgi:hypothetical protein
LDSHPPPRLHRLRVQFSLFFITLLLHAPFCESDLVAFCGLRLCMHVHDNFFFHDKVCQIYEVFGVVFPGILWFDFCQFWI